ncbi:putative transcription factor WD40-like family [Helianthus anomalus]
MLKEFRGHSSYVNDAIFTSDGLRIITTSSDCIVKVGFRRLPASETNVSSLQVIVLLFNFYSGLGFKDCRLSTNIQATTSFEGIAVILPHDIRFLVNFDSQGGDASVNSVHLSPKNPDHVIVCNKTSSIYLMTLQGQVVRSFSSGKKEGGDFVGACIYLKENGYILLVRIDDDAVGCLDKRIRSSVARLNAITSASEVTLVELDGDRDYHMPVELGGSGGMKCWKRAKGSKMIIIEKKSSLKLCKNSLLASDTTWKL